MQALRGPEGPRRSACDGLQMARLAHPRSGSVLLDHAPAAQVVLECLVGHPATHVAERLARVVVREPSSPRLLALFALPFRLRLSQEEELGSREPHSDTLGVVLLRHE